MKLRMLIVQSEGDVNAAEVGALIAAAFGGGGGTLPQPARADDRDGAMRYFVVKGGVS